MAFLAQQGIKTLINITDAPPKYAEEAELHGIRVVSIPVIEFSPPTLQQIEDFLHILSSASGVCTNMYYISYGIKCSSS